MTHAASSERMAEAMQRARKHWNSQLREGVHANEEPVSLVPGLTIAISRDAGANGTIIAEAVGKRLGWPVYDKLLLQHIASEMDLRASLLESVDEKRMGWWQERLDSLSGQPGITQSGYIRHLVESLLSLAAHGCCVIVGRGAAQILPVQTTLRVRIVGPVTERVKVVQARLGLSRLEAESWVEKTDRERARFVKDHFHRDPADPLGYDLVLNRARLSAEQCAELIVLALHQLEARPASAPHEPAHA